MDRASTPARVALATSVYLGLVVVGLAVRLPDPLVATWWPATGFLTGLLYVVPTRSWASYLAPIGVVSLFGALTDDRSAATAVLTVVVSLGQAGALALVLRRRLVGRPWWSSRAALSMVATTAAVATAAGGLLGAWTVMAQADVNWLTGWLSWLVADWLGIVTVLPLTEALLRPDRPHESRQALMFGAVGLPLLHVGMGLLLVRPHDLASFALIAPMLLVFAAPRLGPRAVSLGATTLAAAAALAASQGEGAFASSNALRSIAEAGVVMGLIGILAMLGTAMATEQAAAETAALRSTALLDLAFANAPLPLAILASNGDVLQSNAEMQSLLATAELRDRGAASSPDGIMALASPATHAKLSAALRKATSEASRPATIDLELPADDGAHHFQITLAPMAAAATAPDRVLAVLVDITQRAAIQHELRQAVEHERQAASRLQELDAMRDTLVRAISHDLRTPLVPIIGFSSTLARDLPRLDEAKIVDIADRIHANGLRLKRLLDDLTDLDRLRVGAAGAQADGTTAATLIDQAIAAADLADHRVVTSIDAVETMVDPRSLRRIMDNLLSNAARHTPPGTTVAVALCQDGDAIVLEVSDDGPGVPDEHKEHIFEEFRQGPGSHTEGSGVGLALVRRFARLHGGDAWVEDTAGGSARFIVRLVPDPVPAPTGSDTSAGTMT